MHSISDERLAQIFNDLSAQFARDWAIFAHTYMTQAQQDAETRGTHSGSRSPDGLRESSEVITSLIRKRIRAAGMTQQQLARELGRTASSVSRTIRNASRAKISSLDAIARVLGLRNGLELISGDEAPVRNWRTHLHPEDLDL